MCLRDSNCFRPPSYLIRPISESASARERLEASLWTDLIEGGTLAAFRGKEELLIPPPVPVVRFGVDAPRAPCELWEPTLDEIASIENLADRALAISVNPRHADCDAWRVLVLSVKDTMPFGFAVQSYLLPPPAPSPKIYPWWYKPYRPQVPQPWLESIPSLFDSFEVELPECPPQESKRRRKKKKEEGARNDEAHLMITR